MIWKIVSRNVNYKVRDFLKKKKKSSQCSLINSNEFPFTEIKKLVDALQFIQTPLCKAEVHQ